MWETQPEDSRNDKDDGMNILVIAPHADDEILGVGGTILKYIADNHSVFVCIVTKGYEPLFSRPLVDEILKESKECHRYLGIKKTFYLNYPASLVETMNRNKLNEELQQLIDKIEPELVFIPHCGDMQKDHQLIAEASMVALRPKYRHKVKAIYSYETLSETEWNIPHASNSFLPNIYCDISDYLQEKLEAMKIYHSQLAQFPHPRSLTAIEALSKYRGSTINVAAAEAFSLLRLIL